MTWSIKILRAGTMRLDGGGMFGVVPKTMWERLSPPDDQNRILRTYSHTTLTDRDGIFAPIISCTEESRSISAPIGPVNGRPIEMPLVI